MEISDKHTPKKSNMYDLTVSLSLIMNFLGYHDEKWVKKSFFNKQN